jgi:hypothetical protein
VVSAHSLIRHSFTASGLTRHIEHENTIKTTMISKRLERGEQVDVFELYNGVPAQAQDLKRQRNGR